MQLIWLKNGVNGEHVTGVMWKIWSDKWMLKPSSFKIISQIKNLP